MKNALFFLFIAIFGYFTCQSQHPEREIFLRELGPTKASAFNSLNDSFQQYLASNYPDKSSLGERTWAFLTDILNEAKNGKYHELHFDSLSAIEIITELEETDLRRDILLTQTELATYEQYEIAQFLPKDTLQIINLGEIDDNFEDIFPVNKQTERQKVVSAERERKALEYFKRRPYFNENGLFIYALSKAMKRDESFMHYVYLKSKGAEPTPDNLAQGYLKNLTNQELGLWYNQIPLVIDIYLFDLFHKFVVNKN